MDYEKNGINVPDTIVIKRPETWNPSWNRERALQDIETYVKQYFNFTFIIF